MKITKSKKIKMKKELIDKSLSDKILMISVIFRTSAPCGGGVSTVLEAYEKFFHHLRHIPTWKQTNKINRAWYFAYHYLWFIILMIFDRRIKIVHIHTAANASFFRKSMIAKTAKWFGKKTIMHMHAADFKEYFDASNKKKTIIDTIMQCDRLIVLSPSWKDYFVNIGIETSKIIILNNIVVPPEKTNNREVEHPIRMLFLGDLGQRKGIRDLLNVLIEHHEELSGKYHLRFGGNGYEEEIKNIITENHIEDIATFEGWVYGEKKLSLLEWADIMILPSYNEGLPVAILEAMSYGQSIISTPVGGIPVVVHHGENGFIVTPGNKNEIWKALKSYIDNPKMIRNHGVRSLDIVREFSPECVLSHLKSIYTELL